MDVGKPSCFCSVRILPAYFSIAAWSFSALAILYAFQAFFRAPQV